MLVFTQKLAPDLDRIPDWTIALTAEQRTKTRQHIDIPGGDRMTLCLDRGVNISEGDRLISETGDKVVAIVAQPEPVITVTAQTNLDLIRAAYHLGNRHVPLEITSQYLRLEPDGVLADLLIKLGCHVTQEIAPFYPDRGAYHGHDH
ncbi:MAG: urease accessory protein UreE [Limnospira maxima]|uniref:Urease accessory protein UreE n=1 Tax=Limnospira indica PCC 8005 TaxID=376219 RepID=A0A9P1KHM2_9CYAN|nr:urease accessory protein UreE [Limnospira indica]RAQ49195.1 urease accessory protein UreE [Arthrospira sp. O9.13F]CDM97192.1 urease accessory protein [Limnospira indica PCC 8005]